MGPRRKATIYYAGFLRFGGVLSHVKTLESELRKLGWEVTVVTLDSLPLWCRYAPHLLGKIWDVFDSPMGLLQKDRLTGLLYRLLFDTAADVRIFEDVYIGWNSTTPSVTMLHAVWSDNLHAFDISAAQREKFKSHEAAIIESISHPVATVSHPYFEYITERHYGRRLSKAIEVVELGVQRFALQTQHRDHAKSIVYAGTLEARKNVGFLLEVFKRLSSVDQAFELTIIGDGPDRKRLSEFVKGNGLKVHFLGMIGRDEVARELLRHGLYLHASFKESFSFALLEAKLAGLKTFAYARLQVPREFIDEPIDSFDADEWRDRILTSAPDRRAPFDPMKYSADRMARRTLELAR